MKTIISVSKEPSRKELQQEAYQTANALNVFALDLTKAVEKLRKIDAQLRKGNTPTSEFQDISIALDDYGALLDALKDSEVRGALDDLGV